MSKLYEKTKQTELSLSKTLIAASWHVNAAPEWLVWYDFALVCVILEKPRGVCRCSSVGLWGTKEILDIRGVQWTITTSTTATRRQQRQQQQPLNSCSCSSLLLRAGRICLRGWVTLNIIFQLRSVLFMSGSSWWNTVQRTLLSKLAHTLAHAQWTLTSPMNGL